MRRIKESLERIGRRLYVCKEDGSVESSFVGTLSALRYKNKMYVEPEPTNAGFTDGGWYLLIASPDAPVPPCRDRRYINDKEKNYYTLKKELFYIEDKPLYIRAILRERV